MYNDNLWVQDPGLCLWEAEALDGLNELLDLQKCDQSLGLCPGLGQSLRPIPEKFMGAGQDRDTSTRPYSPWPEPPRAQAQRVGFRHRAGLTGLTIEYIWIFEYFLVEVHSVVLYIGNGYWQEISLSLYLLLTIDWLFSEVLLKLLITIHVTDMPRELELS